MDIVQTDIIDKAASMHETVGVFSRFSIEISVGLFAILIGILKFIGRNALSDIRTLKEQQAQAITKDDLIRLETYLHSELKAIHERVDRIAER